ncbi:transposase [Siccirubricoccus sp. G192]|uniref:IS701 family transposase n=1 Tax=Siccirubricoccus sp. G192 TaxID=2849651 RepID=UPI0020C2359E|nr:transposase [Siccirubricoccus sp. G192]
MRPSRSPTLRGRLLLLVGFVTLALLAFAILAVWQDYKAEREHAEEQLRDQATALALAVDREFDRAEAAMSILATSAALARGDLETFEAEMRAASARLGGEPIALTTPDGRQVLNTLWAPGGAPVQHPGVPDDAARLHQWPHRGVQPPPELDYRATDHHRRRAGSHRAPGAAATHLRARHLAAARPPRPDALRAEPAAGLERGRALLAVGPRTVAACLRVIGLAEHPGFAAFHRVLNRNAWSGLALARILLRQVVAAFVPAGPIVIGVDHTLERRRGRHIGPAGHFYDAGRSSPAWQATSRGLRWLSAMVLVEVPFAGHVWALPVLTALTPSKTWSEQHGQRHRPVTDWARRLLLTPRRWLPDRTIVAVMDGEFAALELLHALRSRMVVITRLRRDARLFDPPGEWDRRGRPALKGDRQPTLTARTTDPATRWRRIVQASRAGWRSAGWIEYTAGTALWHHSGKPIVPILWVLVRYPDGRREPEAFLCTDTTASLREVLDLFSRRWSMESTYEESHRLELRDGGGRECAVVIHPPAGRGEPHEVPGGGGSATLAELIGRARQMIDAVLGPRPPPRHLGLRSREPLRS